MTTLVRLTRLTSLCSAVLVTFVLASSVVAQDSRKDLKRETKRLRLDEMSSQALESVLSENARAKLLFENSYGWAAFDNLKVQFAISGGGGQGVAVLKETGQRTYMNMGTGGIGLGVGAQRYQVVFLFQDKKTFDTFVNVGWKAEASASATAGVEGVATGGTFTNGMAYYQITDNGLLAGADITGSKYWKDGSLN